MGTYSKLYWRGSFHRRLYCGLVRLLIFLNYTGWKLWKQSARFIMNEKECLYRIMGILEGSEELGGGFLPARLVSKIKEMISVVVKEYQPVIYKEPLAADRWESNIWTQPMRRDLS